MAAHSRARLVPMAVALLIVLAACTGGEADPADPSASAASETTGSGDGKAGTAGTTTAVIADQTFDATSYDDRNPGGTLTTTLRALEVTDETMTLRWALQWDNPDVADDETASLLDFGAKNMPTLTDATNLKQYRPLCTKGEWDKVIDSIWCADSALVSPKSMGYDLSNHSIVEAWAVFAAPQDDDATFDVLMVDGWPSFSAVTPTAAK